MLSLKRGAAMKPAVIFDFNGTMVFDGIYHEQAWKEFSKTLRGQPFTDEEMQMMHGKPNIKIIEYLLYWISFILKGRRFNPLPNNY